MTSASPVQCRRFVVRGKVQGVFFRASTRDVARRLGLTGHAINLSDGSVEVLACGDSTALESMCGWLKKGSPRARVDSIDELPAQMPAPQSFTTG